MTIWFLSCASALIGLIAAVPQLVRMHRSRTAAGQAASGWWLGLTCNLMLGYVHFAGHHDVMLAAGNALSGTLCAAALWQIKQYGTSLCWHTTVDQLPHQEFETLHHAVLARVS